MVSIIPEDADDIAATVSLWIVQKLQAALFFEEVVKVAMSSGKRAICAGPRNPPVVVDETADIDKAARDIVLGGSTDNNIICTDEKEVVAVSSIADALIASMGRQGRSFFHASGWPSWRRSCSRR